MAKLSYRQRKRLAQNHPEDFVFPPSEAHPLGMFPIEDEAHARDALARAHHLGPVVEGRVKAAVHRRYPRIVEKVEW